MTNKIYMVCGLFDASCGEDSIMDASPWTAVFATEKEANKACTMVNNFYYKKCHIYCEFEVREIDLDNLCTVESLKEELAKEYEECWE
jgi:hypothetical protein